MVCVCCPTLFVVVVRLGFVGVRLAGVRPPMLLAQFLTQLTVVAAEFRVEAEFAEFLDEPAQELPAVALALALNF